MANLNPKDVAHVISWAVNQDGLTDEFSKDMVELMGISENKKRVRELLRIGLNMSVSKNTDSLSTLIANLVLTDMYGAIALARIMTRELDLDETLSENEDIGEGGYVYLAKILKDIHSIRCLVTETVNAM
jgi:hypothetical protein